MTNHILQTLNTEFGTCPIEVGEKFVYNMKLHVEDWFPTVRRISFFVASKLILSRFFFLWTDISNWKVGIKG